MGGSFTKMARRLHGRLGDYIRRHEHGGHHHHHHRPDPAAAAAAPRQADETDTLAALLPGLGHRDSVELLLMLEAFLSAGRHLSPRTFSRLMAERGRPVSEGQAAAALDMFSSLGFAEKHYTADGVPLYEHSRPGEHHDHLVCGSCGRTTEFNRPDVDGLIEKIACDENYCHLDHRLVVYGLCPECRRRRVEGLPLSETTPNEELTVVGFNGPEALKQRLRDLGVRRGAHLKILGEQSGSVIALLDGCRLAMGPELADAIIVHSHCRQAQGRALDPPDAAHPLRGNGNGRG